MASNRPSLTHALTALGLAAGVPVLVVVGGADGVDAPTAQRIDDLVCDVLLPVVREVDAAVVDGGTDSGVMRSLGRCRARTGWKGPLVGVAVKALVGPGTGATLEPHHTHVLLTPGWEWGDESAVLADVADALAAGRPTVTALLNGGSISRADVEHSLERSRPVLAFAASGRLAAELASRPPEGVIPLADADGPESQRTVLRALLQTERGHQDPGSMRRTS